MDYRLSTSQYARLEVGDYIDTSECIDVTLVKSFIRVTGPAEDALITRFIGVARAMAERLTGRVIRKRAFKAWWDAVPGRLDKWWDGTRQGPIGIDRNGAVELPILPVFEITAVKSFQDSDVATVMDPDQYFLDDKDDNLPARVCLKLGAVWPVFTKPRLGFCIEFKGGYATLPDEIAHAVLLMASWLYRNRGDCTDSGCAGDSGAMSFLRRFKIEKMA